MTADEAKKLIMFLEMNFARDYPSNSRTMMISELLKFSYSDGKKAIDNLLLSERMLPVPAVVFKNVRSCATDSREIRAAKERRENQSSQSFLTRSKEDDEHAKKACLLIRAIIGGIDREKIIEGMMHMQNMRPQAGWATEAHHLKQFYDEKGIVL